MHKNPKRLKILFLTARFPFPIIGGDRLKPNYILRHLAKHHDVTLVSFYQGASLPSDYRDAIETLGIKLHVIYLNPVIAGVKSLSSIITNKPLEIAYYYDKRYKQKVDKLLSEGDFDLAFSFFMRTAEYLKNKDIKKVLIAEDCRITYQKRSFESSTTLKQRLVRYWEWQKLKKYEPGIVNYFDITTLVSEQDIEKMKKNNDKVNYRLLSNGTDTNKFIPPQKNRRKGIVFAGKFDVWANELMVDKIINDIFPLIKKKLPDAQLHLVGANPNAKIRSYAGDSIYIHPNVPDMLPYLQNAELFLHPHNGGSGIQNKLIEAMACGCPVVTTHTGIQGINAKDGVEALLGSTPEELASNAIRLLNDNDLAESIGNNARLLIEKTLSWSNIYHSLDNIIEELS